MITSEVKNVRVFLRNENRENYLEIAKTNNPKHEVNYGYAIRIPKLFISSQHMIKGAIEGSIVASDSNKIKALLEIHENNAVKVQEALYHDFWNELLKNAFNADIGHIAIESLKVTKVDEFYVAEAKFFTFHPSVKLFEY
jgi:hypothetical protein